MILDVESYQSLRDTVLMLHFIAQGEEDVRAGCLIPQEEVFARVASRLKPDEFQREVVPGLAKYETKSFRERSSPSYGSSIAQAPNRGQGVVRSGQ